MKTRKKGRVPSKKLTINEAAERLVGIAEKHLATLNDAERKARLETFHKTVSRICDSHSKSEVRSRMAVTPALARGQG